MVGIHPAPTQEKSRGSGRGIRDGMLGISSLGILFRDQKQSQIVGNLKVLPAKSLNF